MLMELERRDLVKWSREVVKRGLTKGTGGNLSIYNKDKNIVAITPSGLDFMIMREEDIVITDIDGNIIEGKLKPSSELDMHLYIYKNRKDINCIIHAHTIYATAVACMNEDLPPIHYMIALAGNNVRCAKYATFGTEKLAENVLVALENRNAALLANHGIVAGSYNLSNTLNIIEEVEYVAQLYFICKSMGKTVILNDNEMNLMKEKFKNYGQR